ncbi:MAG: TVP38/TMEM64 family protein [Clostridium sp.]|nr:TVP38/TMEM64 family protein [Clostridium sp.]
MKKIVEQFMQHKKIVEITGWIVVFLFILWCLKSGIMKNPEQLAYVLKRCGIMAPLLFMVIQAVQVVVPVLPGSIGCAFGVMFFGAAWGFVYNYIGICIGSIWAFLVAKRYGIVFVKNVTGDKFYQKYQRFLDKKKQFERIFALLIFLPVAPDDFLCYLAGVSSMSLKRFTVIILLGKPLAIFLYSMGLYQILQYGIRTFFG